MWETGKILSHIQHKGSCRNRMFGIGSLGNLLRSELMTALHTEVFHHLHGLGYLLAQNATRSFLYHYRFPGRRDAGILVFATIDTVEGDAARRIFPRVIADDADGSAILQFDFERTVERRRTIGNLHLGVSSTLLIIESVPQQYRKLVLAFLQQRSHIVSIVKDGLVVIAPQRGENGIRHLLPVDAEFIETQSHNLHRCLADISRKFHFFLQPDALS